VSLIWWRWCGRLFHAVGPAQEKPHALSELGSAPRLRIDSCVGGSETRSTAGTRYCLNAIGLIMRHMVIMYIYIYVYMSTAAAVPPPFRPGNPDLCGSHPLVAPYYCRLGDLLCFVFICMIIVFFCYLCNVCVPSVLWYCWLGLLTCKNCRPYNLYCVGGDVKPCSINLCVSL